MLFSAPLPDVDSPRQAVRKLYRADEATVIEALVPIAEQDIASRTRTRDRARTLVENIRQTESGKGGLDALLNEFSLSTDEGIVLMCLAEALLRVPDKHTMDCLIRDKLSEGDWAAHLGNSESLFVSASTWGLLITGKLVTINDRPEGQQLSLLKRTLGRLGEPVIRAAVRYALQIMGTQFVLGDTIGAALRRAQKLEARGFRYSYDMLGEAARTAADAQRYYQSYLTAIEHIGKAAAGRGPVFSPGISVKLSALHPRYEFGQRQRVMEELLPRLKQLVLSAKSYNIGFTVDAEEADRLDLSLDLIEAVVTDPALESWHGFGLAVQAYQKRALAVVEWANALAARTGRRLMVRLVKGAYWDTEIKHAQAEGYSDYPVFTSKSATDLSYQACARKLLQYRANLYPQFATHNAYTLAAVLEMAGDREGFEFQRLHGMGQALYDYVVEQEKIPCRIYAPVGQHADLLAYLVRRLLENGANSSFVNNIVNSAIPVDALLADPVETVRCWNVKRNVAIPLPGDLYGRERPNSCGQDVTDAGETARLDRNLRQYWARHQVQLKEIAGGVAVRNPAATEEVVGYHRYATAADIERKLEKLHKRFSAWSAMPVTERGAIVRRLAGALEQHREELIALCIKEAGKTLADSVAEVREAVDFCRYYAHQAESNLSGFGSEARGVILCISPWNFPLAIFTGQMMAALMAGNTVLAKPAEQTSLIAQKTVALAHSCGLPEGVVELVIAPGPAVGEQVVPDTRIRGVMFTGSTRTAQWISRTLARRPDGPVPLVAETGGQNAMIVDSTALPEQVVDDVITSGFQSAGQRCSALRVLFLQEDVADHIIEMIAGAMAELRIGDPARLDTDVGPVIDTMAWQRLHHHMELMQKKARLLYQCQLPETCDRGHFFAPVLFEIDDLSVLTEEVFGPVVHVVRFRAEALDRVIERINATGYGLTLGVHSRIHKVKQRIAQRARVGNIYINRNMIGAVVGVQPFGGRGLSGTGPKAGGPLYLSRLVQAAPRTRGDDVALQNIVAPQNIVAEGVALEAPVLETLLGEASRAKEQWQSLPVKERADKLRIFLFSLIERGAQVFNIDAHTLHRMGKAADLLLIRAEQKMAGPRNLPGPTGETNRLLVESRGLLVSLVTHSEDFSAWVLGVTAALVSGNTLVCVADAHALVVIDSCRPWLQEAGLSAPFFSVYSRPVTGDLASLLQHPSIDGVLTTPNCRWLSDIEVPLAARKGPILPLICEQPGNFYLHRFIVEKTITEDTTASGGNASLMTLTDEHLTGEIPQAV